MERRKILIATKTYPSISKKYRETVCTAGVLLDEEENPVEWIRIYPIRFRELDFEKRYKRWSIISAEIERNEKDYRQESYRINDSSIHIVREIGTKNNWQERKSFVLPLQFDSISEIEAQGKSLGIIKPKSIEKYFFRNTDREWSPKQQVIQDQGDLFEPSVELEKIPYQFGYKFTTVNGARHTYTVSDWEISELYRKCRDRASGTTLEEREKEAVSKVKQKMEDEFLSKKDIHFIVGNLKNHSRVFMIIGIFYPPKTVQKQEVQTLSLFDL
ncbi:hypothetical protein Q2T42_02580 [Leptolyngbya boryana CZ1]|uniref:Uncharacterized protein n=1 Tax=Leptolyngbya boryana CZ1 TaxID=3060204 RepID=A0AA96WYY2_LEPBY|nr:hypothetical protein [Leptolyngbya boryana]WNZ46724.1 hypothetical protein Q2T42_02580 [Leptolyngbya boryana CZ1]